MILEDGRPLAPDDHPLAVGLRTGRPQSRVVIGVVDDHDATRWYSVSVQPLREHSDRAGALVCSFSDITDRKNVEEQLSFQATHDSLTRLPNRDLVLHAIADELAGAQASGTSVAVLLIDLDRFKTVNDGFGHAHRRQRPEGRREPPLGVLPGRRPARPPRRRRVRHGVPGLEAPDQAATVARRVADDDPRPGPAPLRSGAGRTASIGVACMK